MFLLPSEVEVTSEPEIHALNEVKPITWLKRWLIVFCPKVEADVLPIRRVDKQCF